jgi:type 1 glutamine amidotransferase
MLHLLSSVLVAAALAANAPAEPVRVLVVTGVDSAHNWKLTTPALRAVLEEGGRCDVRVVEDPDVLATDLPSSYDVIVLHFQNPKPLPHEAQVLANLGRLVSEQGKGLVVLHFACGAFPDRTAEFGQVAGMVWNKKDTHDPRGPFAVRITDPSHPITRDLKDFDDDDELYIGLAECRPVSVLAVAKSKVTGRDHPMAFTFESGRGRVFHTPLGHDAKAIQMPGVAELIRRGTTWAAGRTP